MRKVITLMVGIISILSVNQTFAYDLTSADLAVASRASDKIETMITRKGASYREKYIKALQKIQSVKPKDSRLYSVIGETIKRVSVVRPGDTISINYTGKLEDGTIFDSSFEEIARGTAHYAVTRDYEPLIFTVGAGQMIPGLDAGVVGMSVGDKKTIMISPKDGYGEGVVTTVIQKSMLQDKITQIIPRDELKDVVTSTVSNETLADSYRYLKVGDELTKDGSTTKVIKKDAFTTTFEIKNTSNPFYGQELRVGLKVTFDGNTFTIVALDNKNATISIDNKQGPFYGKKLAVGLEGKASTGEKVVIKSIDGENVTLEVTNTHELAGKTLIFDIEIVSIRSRN